MAFIRKASEVCNYAVKVASGQFGPTEYRGGSDGGGYRSNVGEWWNGSWHFDCLGYVHTMVNGFVGDKSKLGGGAIMDDFVNMSAEYVTLVNYCSVRGKFPVSYLKPGSLLEMHQVDGHVALYVGTIGSYNMAECTGGGVRLSWVDLRNGNYYNSAAGGYRGTFENWGEFDRVEYDGKEPGPQPTPVTTKSVSYMSYDSTLGIWLPEVTSTTTVGDTMGMPGHYMGNVMVKNNSGEFTNYCVHNANGGWLPIVTGYDVNDYNNGFAGVFGIIDGFALYSKTPMYYRAKLLDSQQWLPWVSSLEGDYTNLDTGMAGILGYPIDEIEIKLA